MHTPPRGVFEDCTPYRDHPYPGAGCRDSGHRAARIREMIESRQTHSVDDFQAMQKDVLSRRAIDCVPALVALLETRQEPDYQQVAEIGRAHV